jgi:hypothetical protein
VRLYGNQIGGSQYSLPFGPVSDFEIIARKSLQVECFDQDVNDRLWERQVHAGEIVKFAGDRPDYLVISRSL